jgi:hypothetical protein
MLLFLSPTALLLLLLGPFPVLTALSVVALVVAEGHGPRRNHLYFVYLRSDSAALLRLASSAATVAPIPPFPSVFVSAVALMRTTPPAHLLVIVAAVAIVVLEGVAQDLGQWDDAGVGLGVRAAGQHEHVVCGAAATSTGGGGGGGGGRGVRRPRGHGALVPRRGGIGPL